MKIWTTKMKNFATGKLKEHCVNQEGLGFIDTKRITVKDSFEFIIETVGPFTNYMIVEKAASVMIK